MEEIKEFLISDTHFGHRNIIRYCDRPFWTDKSTDPYDEDVSRMNETMIKNWNDVVGVDDVIYHLGDFAFLDKAKLTELRWRLNGRIRLVMGNHDYRHGYQFYQDLKLDRVYDKPIIWHQFFIMSHEPIFLSVDNGPIQTVSKGKNDLKDSGLMHCVNLHGHIHELSYKDPHYFNACVELNNYTPINLLELEQKYLLMNQ
jgi:calcineurin-like phosphoesterase family protein